jgi:hypothetical protein
MVGFLILTEFRVAIPSEEAIIARFCHLPHSKSVRICILFFFASCDIYPSDGRLMLIAELPRAPILAMIFPNCIVEGIGLVSEIDKEG